MKNKLPLVTIFVCTYKKFEFLKDAIDSIFFQDYPNIELFISDDGSPNYDRNMIDELVLYCPENIRRVEIIHHIENIGTVRNLNNIVRNSEGKYLICLAQDDLFYNKTSISEIVNFFITNDALIVTSRRKAFKKKLNDTNLILPSIKDSMYLEEDNGVLFKRLCVNNFISGSSTYYSKDFFEKLGLFNENYKLLEDYPKYLEIVRKGVKIHYLNLVTKYYRLGGISTAKSKNQVLLNDVQKVIDQEVLPYLGSQKILKQIALLNKYMYQDMKSPKFLYLLKFPKEFFYKVVYQMGIVKIKEKENRWFIWKK